jgi:hypothetical protein
MASGKIVVQYAEVTGEDPRLLAVFPESPFMRATDMVWGARTVPFP